MDHAIAGDDIGGAHLGLVDAHARDLSTSIQGLEPSTVLGVVTSGEVGAEHLAGDDVVGEDFNEAVLVSGFSSSSRTMLGSFLKASSVGQTL